MFESVGWGEILVLALVGLFVLGPERLPGAIQWVGQTLRTVRDYATGARDQLRNELGPEFEEFRKPLEELRAVRDLDPRRAVRRHLFDPPEDGSWSGTSTPGAPDPQAPDPRAPDPRAPDPRAAGTAAATGLPAAGAGGALKPRSAAPDPLAPGEPAPLDPDAT